MDTDLTSYNLMMDIMGSNNRELYGEVITPKRVAQDMIELLPPLDDKTFWNPDTTFLDPFCKSGIFLQVIMDKLMKALQNFEGYEDEKIRRKHIIEKQLYGLQPEASSMVVSRSLTGEVFGGNIASYDIRKTQKISKSSRELLIRIKERLGQEFNKMNFNVVIGNPPYNRGGDIDFVNTGFELSTDYVVMITPAKWQTAEADQRIASKMSYGEFRKKLVPHMREVVFYPECSEVFGIAQADGITYYLIDKGIHDNCKVINKCKIQGIFESVDYRDIKNEQSLLNFGNEIISYLGEYKVWKWNIAKSGRYEVWINAKLLVTGAGGGKRCLLMSKGDTLVIQRSHIIDTNITDRYSSDDQSYVFKSDSLSECESFISWLDCKLNRFLVLSNLSKLTGVFTNHYFRFVPSPMVLDEQGNRVPGKFDHIYTDEELYKTWNLPQKYIDVIEAVIKERA